ncbi:glycogen synthase GlgA [Falsirhodobacter halotolerans]|uniref:glycogen synthase GlgA n=1 Tax=Falsirhodobacter halotolerans TaxID=1146892 RepID=UPI001FD0D45A|nr:glycogen synthase GlgA [Falsirhodobacter halotolerans]MCJ8139704.1 glycogen synthase GlgA [Falsirhodobacter halotolerans]
MSKSIQVLSVVSECVPLLKTGGLADVAGALPGALMTKNVHMRVLMPAYRNQRWRLEGMKPVFAEDDLMGGPATVFAGQVGGIDFLLLDAPHLYDREGGPYSGPQGDWEDNPQRFAALSWIGARIAREGLNDGWLPQIMHCHDWQAGFAPAYLAWGGPHTCKSILTIHNIAFQGWAKAELIHALRLPAHEFHVHSLEYYDGLSSLKAGLVTADRITTVSPNYAIELMRAEYGMGLQGVLAERAEVVSGILNGVDTQVWSPEAEDKPYAFDNLRGKIENRQTLCAAFDLEVPGPLAIVVSRMTDQKGIDLLPEVLPEFIEAGGGVAILGAGDPVLEGAMRALELRYPDRVGVRVGYDEGLSHLMFSGGDAVLVPSRFEPCGLTQMYGLRYGTLPVVAGVGGLADSVINVNPASMIAGVATGFVFSPTTADALAGALRRLVRLWHDPEAWAQVQRNAMRHPVGWEASADAYSRLYADLLA